MAIAVTGSQLCYLYTSVAAIPWHVTTNCNDASATLDVYKSISVTAKDWECHAVMTLYGVATCVINTGVIEADVTSATSRCDAMGGFLAEAETQAHLDTVRGVAGMYTPCFHA